MQILKELFLAGGTFVIMSGVGIMLYVAREKLKEWKASRQPVRIEVKRTYRR